MNIQLVLSKQYNLPRYGEKSLNIPWGWTMLYMFSMYRNSCLKTTFRHVINMAFIMSQENTVCL